MCRLITVDVAEVGRTGLHVREVFAAGLWIPMMFGRIKEARAAGTGRVVEIFSEVRYMKYAIFAGLLLSGCGAAIIPTSGKAPAANAPDTCDAAAHQGLVGLDAASSLALPEPKRLNGPTDAVTLDFNPARLNVQLDDTDNIIAITCG